MEGLEVRELIQKWREISALLEEKQKELETSREGLSSLKLKYTKATEKWEEEKAHIQNTIARILDEVSSKKNELLLMEKEMKIMQEKIEERKQRNGEYATIISGKRSKVEFAVKEAEKRDKEPKELLESFIMSRDAINVKLLALINGVREQSSLSSKAHTSIVTNIREKIENTIRVRNAESNSWVLEQGTRCWAAKTELRQLLLEESATCATKKELWAGLLSEVHNLSSNRAIETLSSYSTSFQNP